MHCVCLVGQPTSRQHVSPNIACLSLGHSGCHANIQHSQLSTLYVAALVPPIALLLYNCPLPPLCSRHQQSWKQEAANVKIRGGCVGVLWGGFLSGRWLTGPTPETNLVCLFPIISRLPPCIGRCIKPEESERFYGRLGGRMVML